MKLQRTWLGYIIWGLFSIILFSNIGFSAFTLTQSGTSDLGFFVTLGIVISVIFPGAFLIILSYRLFMRFLYSKIFSQEDDGGEHVFVEYIFLGLATFFAIFLRLMILIQTDELPLDADYYINLALSGSWHLSLNNATNGEVIYINFIHIIFQLLGEKIQLAIIVQMIMQVFACILTFFGVRKAFGKIAGWITFAILAFSPGCINWIIEFNPSFLFVFILEIYFFILFCIVRKVNAEKSFFDVLGLIILGLIASFLVYYDTIGIVAIICAILYLGCKKVSKDESEKTPNSFSKILTYILSFLGGIILFFLFIEKDNENVLSGFNSYLMQFVPGGEFRFDIPVANGANWDCLVLLLFVFIWFAAFIKEKSDHLLPMAFSVIYLFTIYVLGINKYPLDVIYGYLWAIMAGVGICSIHTFVLNEETVENVKQKRIAKREQRALKRSIEAGEKSIQLNTFNSENDISTPMPYSNDKKSYGIGKKTTDVSLDNTQETLSGSKQHELYETSKEISLTKDYEKKTSVMTENVSTETAYNSSNKTMVATVPTLPKTEDSHFVSERDILPPQFHSELDNRTDKVEVIKSSSPIRRGYRTPSKSTFSPEQLEQIRQHTKGEFDYHSREEMQHISDVNASNTELRKDFIHVIDENKIQTKIEPDKDVDRALNEIDAFNRGEITSKITVSEQNPIPKLIKNPLPGPKPHVPKELSFDYNPKEYEMDFDIIDLSGKDYYDI